MNETNPAPVEELRIQMPVANVEPNQVLNLLKAHYESLLDIARQLDVLACHAVAHSAGDHAATLRGLAGQSQEMHDRLDADVKRFKAEQQRMLQMFAEAEKALAEQRQQQLEPGSEPATEPIPETHIEEIRMEDDGNGGAIAGNVATGVTGSAINLEGNQGMWPDNAPDPDPSSERILMMESTAKGAGDYAGRTKPTEDLDEIDKILAEAGPETPVIDPTGSAAAQMDVPDAFGTGIQEEKAEAPAPEHLTARERRAAKKAADKAGE